MKDFEEPAPDQTSIGRATREDRVYLYCVRSTIRTAAVLDSQELMDALVEDTCLRIAERDRIGRLPSRLHHSARARWRAEGAFLGRETRRLRTATEYTLAQTPAARPEYC
jgi:hypothetical protein